MAAWIRSYETLEVVQQDRLARVTLNRPKVHNAFDEVMIAELGEVFTGLAEDPELRVVVLTGAGASFCAGADMHWMKRVAEFTYEENLAEIDAIRIHRTRTLFGENLIPDSPLDNLSRF